MDARKSRSLAPPTQGLRVKIVTVCQMLQPIGEIFVFTEKLPKFGGVSSYHIAGPDPELPIIFVDEGECLTYRCIVVAELEEGEGAIVTKHAQMFGLVGKSVRNLVKHGPDAINVAKLGQEQHPLHAPGHPLLVAELVDRKSTRLNSSH